MLDKSRSDWKDFKGANEQLEEELETYKKSSGTVGGHGRRAGRQALGGRAVGRRMAQPSWSAQTTPFLTQLRALCPLLLQYLEKKEFLQRAELREYEQERDKRLASDVRTRGRL